VQAAPTAAGIELANWNWKVVRQFIQERFGLVLGHSSCWNYLRRLGLVLKRPKKRLLKANAEKRQAFVAAYVALRAEAQASGAKIFFVDEAHFRADVELRAKWVLRGEPALVDTSSPKFGEKATYYSAVCLETGEVEAMSVAGNTNAETTAAFLTQLREKHPEPLVVIWDNGPAHHGPEIRAYLTTPDLRLRLVALPGYSPDFNPDEIGYTRCSSGGTGYRTCSVYELAELIPAGETATCHSQRWPRCMRRTVRRPLLTSSQRAASVRPKVLATCCKRW
jgi:hypothetical protein